jgi:hypothetical protein
LTLIAFGRGHANPSRVGEDHKQTVTRATETGGALAPREVNALASKSQCQYRQSRLPQCSPAILRHTIVAALQAIETAHDLAASRVGGRG